MEMKMLTTPDDESKYTNFVIAIEIQYLRNEKIKTYPKGVQQISSLIDSH